jgi:hypothetical protein
MFISCSKILSKTTKIPLYSAGHQEHLPSCFSALQHFQHRTRIVVSLGSPASEAMLTSSENRSFSLIFPSSTVDLEASTENQRDLWVFALRWVKDLMDKAQAGSPYNFKHITHVDRSYKW